MSASGPVNPEGAELRLAWDAPGLQERLTQWAGPVSVRAVAHTASTNTDLLELVRGQTALAQVPRVLLAERQTQGRGRLGRPWVAQPGASLTFSIGWALRPRQGWGGLSLAVGHAVAQALQPWSDGRPLRGEGRLMLKWPNDLWWLDPAPHHTPTHHEWRKVAGILIETLPLPPALFGDPRHPQDPDPGPAPRWVVVGVGINVRAEELGPEGLPEQGVAGTSQWRPQDEAPILWHAVADAISHALVDFEAWGFEPIRASVQARDLLIGQPVTLSAGPVTQGLCCGLDGDGALLVQSASGVHRVVAGEVQVRPASGRAAPLASG